MSLKSPILNPIRFHGTTPNYSTIFPNPDNYIQRSKIIEGIHPVQWFKEWLSGKTLYLQFQIDNASPYEMSVYKYNESTEVYDLQQATITPTDITPAEWYSLPIHKYTLNLSAGTYYLSVNNYLSDVFVVTSSTINKKKLVEIVYTNEENDYGCVLVNQTFTQYFTGQLIPGNPENEISAFESDRGELMKLRSTPKRIATLSLNDIHFTYIDHINMIFSCDTLTINGMTYENTEPPSIETIEGSDLVNITIKLTQTSNEYYYIQ